MRWDLLSHSVGALAHWCTRWPAYDEHGIPISLREPQEKVAKLHVAHEAQSKLRKKPESTGNTCKGCGYRWSVAQIQAIDHAGKGEGRAFVACASTSSQ